MWTSRRVQKAYSGTRPFAARRSLKEVEVDSVGYDNGSGVVEAVSCDLRELRRNEKQRQDRLDFASRMQR